MADSIESIEDDSEINSLCRDVVKYSIKTNNPNFHNQLFGTVDFYGLGAEWITSALNTSIYTFEMAPAFTVIENEVIRIALEIFGIEDGDGIFCIGGSTSNLYGIHLGRYKKFPSTKMEGNPPGLVMFTSDDSHYSVMKAASVMGIGTNNVVTVESNEYGQMLVDDLEAKINAAIAKKLTPFFVNATCGTTVSF